MDNLNFYSAWLPAGQLTDRYSSKPGCLRSKNLDIFSSSKSVKATAWSEPTTTDADIVKQDWKLILKTDWKVYERENGVDTLVVDPSVNFPVYPVSYNWRFGTYEDATWGTVQDLVAKYEWDELKSYVVFTDRASYTWSSVKFTPEKEFWDHSSNLTFHDGQYVEGYMFNKNTSTGYQSYIDIKIKNPNFSTVPIKVYANQYASSETDISLTQVNVKKCRYFYDPELDQMVYTYNWDVNLPLPDTDIKAGQVTINVPCMPWQEDRDYFVRLTFSYTRHEWVSTYWWSGNLYVDFNDWTSWWIMSWEDWDYYDYYSYLPVKERKLTPIGEYYWMEWTIFQILDTWSSGWVTVSNDTREKKLRYEFTEYMWWNNDINMDVIGMVVWNEQVYMIWNLDWNWYIIPCDLSWSRWTPFIAYWCTFKGVTNIDYLMYLVWEDRWVSQLWVFNNQELVSAIWWKLESQYNDIVWVEEQYKFDWKILNWRKNLILTTTDNRIFQYGQTYGGKGGTFIHELPENATITWLKTNWDDLEVDYSITEGQTTTKYAIKYQDDTPIKNYNTQWEATYPIVIWNHLLEKEESDLYCSYILPSAETSLEFWGMANHYHFWTFKTDWNTTPTAWSSWIIDWADWNYHLEFVEKNWEYLTFKLVWDLPVMTGDETMRLTEYLTMQEPTYIWYTEFNHFRKIWEITTTEYQEWEFRFHNLNNKLELPKSHSLQIMVKGKGNQDYTPELFALDLVANQRERW